MSFSRELLELAKKKLELTKDAQLLELIPNMEKGTLSKIKSGNRDLTDAQALAIAEHCGFNTEWVLVSLAADTTKSEAVKSVWSTLAKKLLTGALMLCVLKISGSYLVPDLGKHRFLARSRLFA
ncbi:hypothetical protein EMM73_16030 [Rheinheimera sediminis]|uniref:DUF3693 domain-containing protein n=1 Tax=Rheinheimera sp. YQF-1 TaxID=2499626 RepID=UPI000FD7372E|nr:DUF3693 domain-containing protein [Rheinheimera sp. YQF-1]RVT44640.1 hypothetical protein EMM73_16030 [Rheinheimera sp. YQF-1]